MLTRRAASMEDKLRATLKELESAKALCKELLQERDDSEVELKKIIDKNAELKSELSELHIHHMDILNQHQQLRQIVADYQHCMDTHEQSLKRIAELECELSDAYRSITQLESQTITEQATNTSSLYNELVGSASGLGCKKQPIIIDLTGNDSLSKITVFKSHNKLKKYIRINRFIKKYQRSVIKQNTNKVNLGLRKQHINLKCQLKQSISDSILCRSVYEKDVKELQDQLLEKEKSLNDIFNKYSASQIDYQERMVEAGELVDLVRYNAERYESLTNNLCCTCSVSPLSSEPQPVTPAPEVMQPSQPTDAHKIDYPNKVLSKTSHLFTDKIGQNFGRLINCYSQHFVTNICVPGASFSKLTKTIEKSKLNIDSTAVLLYGDSLNVSKRDIIKCVELMININKKNNCKFIICALPYAKNLTVSQNEYIFNLNMFLSTLCHYHNEIISFFDCNKFLSYYKLTKHTMYMPIKCRRRIAKLLAYNLQNDTSTSNVLKIMECVSSSTNTSIDPSCSLNYKVGQRVDLID